MIHRNRNRDYVQIKRYLPPATRSSKKPRLKDIIYIVVCSLILTGIIRTAEHTVATLFPPHTVIAGSVLAYQSKAVPTPTPKTVVKYLEVKTDDRALRLKKYLEFKHSPLSNYAGYIIQKSDNAGIDWTLMVAIAGKESTYGVNCPEESHNPFGLGGTKFMHFDTWEDSIDYESNLLSKFYREHMVAGIQHVYCPDFECASNWTESVVAYAKEILAVDK